MAQVAAIRSWGLTPSKSGFGNGSIDRAQIEGTPGDDHIHGRKGPDTIDGLGGDDVLNGRYGDDTLDGGAGDDVLSGSTGVDTLFGGAGADRLYGGTERQEGGATGRDQLDGGDGNDQLYGGFEEDVLTGGDGKDRFSYREVSDSSVDHPDRVLDFEQGIDKVAFRGAFREAGDLHFIGHAAFSGTPGEVRFDAFSDHSLVSLDFDGDGLKDFQIIYIGDIHFKASDFSF